MPNSHSPTNPWFGISMALIGVIVGYGIAMGTVTFKPVPTPKPQVQQPQKNQPQAPQAQKEVVAPDPAVDHIRGNKKAVVSLIEYSDFECPFCKRHHPTMQQALTEYGDKVNWVYRHYPLSSLHPNAKPAATASECVAEIAGNDGFWEFADMVFDRGPDQGNLESYAQEIGVDMAKYRECYESGKYSEHVDQQLAEGSAAGVRGTPGTFVYNTKTKETRYISGAQPYANVKAAIDDLL